MINDLKFYVVKMISSTTLFVANMRDESLWIYDNETRDWRPSMLALDSIENDPDFVRVGEDWSNEYISVADAIQYFTDEAKNVVSPN